MIIYTITDIFGNIIESFLDEEERDEVWYNMIQNGLQVGWGSVE